MDRPDTFARIWAVAVADHGDRPLLVCPRAIVVLDEVPKTSVGKIRTFILKEAASR